MDFANLFVLILTLAVLIWYTIETHKIAKQTVETNLRPVVLRSGFLSDWSNAEGAFLKEGANVSPLEFSVFKNIATDIKGRLVVNGYSYELCFGNDISKVENKIGFTCSWGWMKADTKIFAVCVLEDAEATNESNRIHLTYKDIEGNEYYTIEDENFVQKSFRGKIRNT